MCSPEEGIGSIEAGRSRQILRHPRPSRKAIVCKQPSTSMVSLLAVDTSAAPRSWEYDTNFHTPDEVPNDNQDQRIPLVVGDLVAHLVGYPVEPNAEGFRRVAWLRVVGRNARIQAAL